MHNWFERHHMASVFEVELRSYLYEVRHLTYMPSLGSIDPPKMLGSPPKFRSPLDTKAAGPPLIYLVGPLAISDPHINICVGPHNTCVALKKFNLLTPNTML